MYSPLKPDAGPSPRIDVVQINTDFAQFAAIFSNTVGGVTYNHTGFNKKNQGCHESVIMELQAADPGVNNDLTVLYNKNGPAVTGGPQPQLFLQIPQFLPKIPDTTANLNLGMQLTYNQVNIAGPQYQSFLPRGELGAGDTGGIYLIYMGSDTGVTAQNTNISDTITLSPIPSQILVAIATSTNLTTVGNPQAFTVSTNIINNFQFTINSTSNLGGGAIPYDFRWVAIARS
jgi:hypothetical protein